jgi:hypothetical protein
MSTVKTTKWLFRKIMPAYYDPLFHVTHMPTSSRFREVFHQSLPSLQGHLSKELT